MKLRFHEKKKKIRISFQDTQNSWKRPVKWISKHIGAVVYARACLKTSKISKFCISSITWPIEQKFGV